ncbi:MAG: NUDIX domain-containing protein [Chloroflexota bacterium]
MRTVIVLFQGERLLLLKRAAWKRFAQNRWTGLGGKVEPSELNNLDASARRELFEEADLAPGEVSDLRLLRTLTFYHPIEGLVCLVYYVGECLADRLPACNEGTLAWVQPSELPSLDLIENTARVLPLLVADRIAVARSVRSGIASYGKQGELQSIVWERD